MRVETWGKVWCPACNVPNWICQGDLSDLTVCDVIGICCHACEHKFRLDQDEDDGDIEDDEIDYEKGLPAPR